MRLASYRGADGSCRPGLIDEGGLYDLAPLVDGCALEPALATHFSACGVTPATGGLLRWLQAGPESFDVLQRHAKTLDPAAARAIDEVELLAPLPRPGKIVAIGRNYGDHAAETGVAPFSVPRILFKTTSSVRAPGDSLVYPPEIAKLDFEVELGAVIGRLARHVSEAEALAYVAGYTVLNDLSAREFQFDHETVQTSFAKSMDGFCPMGPHLVTADEIGDPQQLDISSQVNGVFKQQANTRDMLFSVRDLVAYISRYMTLEPGDIIATGTPAGSGAFRKPPEYLRPGDELRLEIEGVGVLCHRIGDR